LGEELGKYDICVNATRFDPGPNSVIEPICCGLPTYVHVDGGGAVEFAGNDHTFSSTDELQRILLNKNFVANDAVNFLPWQDVVKLYVDFIKTI
jgi:hypothetical protein